jgi:glycosyltransferase involved in cell wall biosynthesis
MQMDSVPGAGKDDDSLLSVIIPVWNRGGCLGRCVDSILELGEKAVEIVLIDDASDDDTYDVCLNYARMHSDVVVKRLDRNVGPGMARNIGMEIAKGRWYYFLDSDDQIVKEVFILLLKELKRDPTCQLIRVSAVNITESGDDYDMFTFSDKEGRIDAETYLSIQPKTQVWLYVFRADLLQRYEIRFPGTYIAEDVAFVYMAAYAAKKIFNVPLTVVRHHHHASNMLTMTIAYKVDDDPMYICLKTISQFLEKHFDADLYEKNIAHFGKTPFGKLSALMEPHKNIGYKGSPAKMLATIGEMAKAEKYKVYLSPVSSEAVMVSKVYMQLTGNVIDGFIDNNTTRVAEPFDVATADDIVGEKAMVVLVTLNRNTRDALQKQLMSLGYVCKYNEDIMCVYCNVASEEVNCHDVV